MSAGPPENETRVEVGAEGVGEDEDAEEASPLPTLSPPIQHRGVISGPGLPGLVNMRPAQPSPLRGAEEAVYLLARGPAHWF